MLYLITLQFFPIDNVKGYNLKHVSRIQIWLYMLKKQKNKS